MKLIERARTELGPQRHGRRSFLADQLAVGESRSPLHQPDALSSGTSEIPPSLRLIIAGATSLLSADMVIVRVLDEDRSLKLVASSGPILLPSRRRVGTAFCGIAVRDCAPVVSDDPRTDPRQDPSSQKRAQQAGLRSFIAVPIVDCHKTVGSLAIGTRRQMRFGHSQVERLSFFANQAASALQDAPTGEFRDRLIARHERAVDELATRLDRVERALAVHSGKARAREEEPAHEGWTPVPKRIRDGDLANNALVSKPSFLSSPAEYLLLEGYRSGTLTSFIDNALDPLLEEDRRYGIELVTTLACYLQNSCNMSKTARELFVHINTVRYRLQRCEEIGRFSLEDVDTRFHLQVGLRIARLAGRCIF